MHFLRNALDSLPREHHKHLKSTNLLERFNEELKRHTHVIRIFPNETSCLRRVRALAVEPHEEWLEGARSLEMQPLRGSATAGRGPLHWVHV